MRDYVIKLFFPDGTLIVEPVTASSIVAAVALMTQKYGKGFSILELIKY